MRAVVVLPTPRTPVRIQACGMRPVSNALETVRTTASWPIKSSKLEGRYLRASTRYGLAAPVAPRSKPPRSALSGLWSGAPASVIGRSAMSILSAAFLRKGGKTRARTPPPARFAGKTSRRLTSDPIRTSLGLLPSGPDPVGEWLVHRQSPGPYLGPKSPESKRAETHIQPSSLGAARLARRLEGRPQAR